MLMTYLMTYVLYLIHLMYFSLMLGRVMLTCGSFALVGWTSTPKGGFRRRSLGFSFGCHVSQLAARVKDTPRSINGAQVLGDISMLGLAIDKRSSEP